jgi:hypothetical protein
MNGRTRCIHSSLRKHKDSFSARSKDEEMDNLYIDEARLLRSDSSSSLDTSSEVDLMTANIRDIADLVPEVLRFGRLYRSSQFHTPEVREALGIVAVMDLRRTGERCKRPDRVAQEFLRPDWMFLHAKDTFGDPLAPCCPNCEDILKLQPRASGQDTKNADIKVRPRIVSSWAWSSILSSVGF